MEKVKLAILGAGLIGRTHINVALENDRIDLVGVADPSEARARTCAD